MVTVAFAGANTGLGRVVLRAFFNDEANSRKHKLVLLSRSEKPQWSSKGADVRPVDYEDHDALVKALDGVHTLISFIGGSEAALRNVQIALIKASQEAGVKRFAPSEFAMSYHGDIKRYTCKADVWAVLTKSGLEYTRFSCGIYTNILGVGTPKPLTDVGKAEGAKTGEEEALAGLVRSLNFVVYPKQGIAEYPEDGRSEAVFTDMRDVARYTIAALDLDRWPEELGMRGDVKSWSDVVAIMERVQRRKFSTKELSVDELRREIEENPAKEFYNQCMIELVSGWALVPSQLNDLFPDIKPITVEQYIEKWWSGVDAGEL